MLSNKSSCVTLYQEHENITSLNIFLPSFEFWQESLWTPSGPRDALHTAARWRHTPNYILVRLGGAGLRGLLTRLGQVPASLAQYLLPGCWADSAFPWVSACTPHTKVTMSCRQPCVTEDDQIQACRKAAAEKILCCYGSEWGHVYWTQCIYFCQSLYDSLIAYLFFFPPSIQ